MIKKNFSLKEIANIINGKLLNSSVEILIESLTKDSRHCKKNSIFTAYTGYAVDSHDFLDEAFHNGAVAAVVTDEKRLGNRPGILVDNAYISLSKLSNLFAGEPSKKMLTFGITGTNGKTTIHWILYHLLNKLGYPSIRIGSLGINVGDKIDISGKVKTKTGEIFMTTPGAFEIQEVLQTAVKNDIKTCVLETSSHALDQYRVADIDYDVAVFTNLTPDHLNYHEDMDHYFNAKVRLFKQLAKSKELFNKTIGGAVINIDNSYGKRLEKIATELNLPIYSFGSNENAKIKILEFKQSFNNSILTLEYNKRVYRIETSFIGDYNASNISAVFAACISVGINPEDITEALKKIPNVPGRLEAVGNDRVGVFVDYAHTGDGLKNVLLAVRPFVKNELWVIFGCGGGKDHGKRPAMGRAAKDNADRIVLTNDNPKNDDPENIIEDILSSGCKPEFIELDRGRAIEKTIKRAKDGDVIILAGKGHEDYQIIGNKTIPYSDKKEVEKLKNSGVFF
jgi:UDP-N-acetylmuramoyl-L-alanyl-D-glutamate--2,6-diaminopimelate ligase